MHGGGEQVSRTQGQGNGDSPVMRDCSGARWSIVGCEGVSGV